MELIRLIALLLLSVPQIDAAIPTTEFTARCRATLLRPGMPIEQVKSILRLREYSFQWACGDLGYFDNCYMAPNSRYCVIVHDHDVLPLRRGEKIVIVVDEVTIRNRTAPVKTTGADLFDLPQIPPKP